MANELERRTDRPSIRCTAVLAGTRTDNRSTTQLPSLTDRSSTTALTDHLLGILAITDKPETLPQQTTCWVLSVLQITSKHKCKNYLRSQLTLPITRRK